MMTVIHCLISRYIYLVGVKIYNIAGKEVLERAHFAYATSGLAFMPVFLNGTFMLFALLCLLFRKLKPGMPILGTCSASISAACHLIR